VPPDTVWGSVHTISEERSVNDTLYTIAPHSFATADILGIWPLVGHMLLITGVGYTMSRIQIGGMSGS